MRFTSATQLKDWIKNKSKQTDAPANVLLQTYMMERLLERLSLSPYRDNLILKGGFLIAAMVGIDRRTTMDMHTVMNSLRICPIFAESVNLSGRCTRLSDGLYGQGGRLRLPRQRAPADAASTITSEYSCGMAFNVYTGRLVGFTHSGTGAVLPPSISFSASVDGQHLNISGTRATKLSSACILASSPDAGLQVLMLSYSPSIALIFLQTVLLLKLSMPNTLPVAEAVNRFRLTAQWGCSAGYQKQLLAFRIYPVLSSPYQQRSFFVGSFCL